MQVAFLITILTLFIVVLVYKNEKKKISRIEGNRESGAGRGHHKKKKN